MSSQSRLYESSALRYPVMSVRSTAPGATPDDCWPVAPLMASVVRLRLLLLADDADECACCESQKDMPFVVDDDVLGEQDGEAQAAAVMDARPAMLPRPP